MSGFGGRQDVRLDGRMSAFDPTRTWTVAKHGLAAVGSRADLRAPKKQAVALELLFAAPVGER
jgi:hypothetical protein